MLVFDLRPPNCHLAGGARWWARSRGSTHTNHNQKADHETIVVKPANNAP